ncbi:hypothetical protein ACFQXA_27120 [Nocardiopsis composta]
MTIPRSPFQARETVNGECQSGKRRDADRSTISWRSSVSQEKSP